MIINHQNSVTNNNNKYINKSFVFISSKIQLNIIKNFKILSRYKYT